MARSVYAIKQQIVDSFIADPTTPSDITTSKVSKWLTWIGIVAMAISLFEQILDIFTSETNARIDRAGVGTLPWLVDRVFEFQYGNAVIYDPITGTWSYPPPASSQIITRVGITPSTGGTNLIKVAKNELPTLLSTPELTALSAYLNKIGVAGIRYSASSSDPDYIYVKGDVFYDGQYSSSIQLSVVAAIQNLYNTLSNELNFGSAIKATDIIEAVRAVSGVVDFTLEISSGRANSGTFPGATFSNLGYPLQSQYVPNSGYYAEEPSPNSLSDTGVLNFISV